MTEYVSEKNCALCSKMWPSERLQFRELLCSMPLDELVCNACLMAFARNIGLTTRDDPIEH